MGEGRKDEDKKEETEELTNEVLFLLKDPVAFECMTRCCMTGEECADTALTCKMSTVMKVRWLLRGVDPEDMKEEGKWVNQRRGVHLHLLREVVWKVPRTLPIEAEEESELVTVQWEGEIDRFEMSDWAEEDTVRRG